MPALACSSPRFVGLDVDTQTITVAAVDRHQQVLLAPQRIALTACAAWSRQYLTATDTVVLEATTNAWSLYDQLLPLVASVTVAHPLLIKLIGSARVKTDARAALTLAQFLAAGLIPPVWVPPAPVREVRALIAHRGRVVRQRTQWQNRFRNLLHRHPVVPPPGNVCTLAQRPWWHDLALSRTEQLQVTQDLTLLDSFARLRDEVDAELLGLSRSEPWASPMPFLLQIPGIGVLNAMVLLAAIGDITRLATVKKLVGYSGWGASVHASGQTDQTGGITKQGRRDIRTAMVEAAWVAVEHHPHWNAEFARLVVRLGKNKAIVAIARKLLIVVWHVLTKQVADRHADEAQVARKLLLWSNKLKVAGRRGLSAGAFVRQELQRLSLGHNLTHVGWASGKQLRLPPEEPEQTTLPAAEGTRR